MRRFGVSICIGLVAWLAMVGMSGSLAAGLNEGEWHQERGYRWKEVQPGAAERKVGFTRLEPSRTGVLFTNSLAENESLANQILLNGSGVAAGDVDGDGKCDLYFCGLDHGNKLFRNLGDWKFEDITASAGVGCAGIQSTGAVLADLDGDGDLDLIVNSVGGGTHVFYNDGKGHFEESKTVLNPGKGGMSMALADVDGDGFLDLYIANYRTSALMDMVSARMMLKVIHGQRVVTSVDGRPTTDPDLTNRFVVNARGGIEELGEPDAFYRNKGGRKFEWVPFTGGNFLDENGNPLLDPPLDWGLSVMFRDINGDGLPDIYVCNDFDSPDRIWINRGGGKFQALPKLALRHSSLFSMGIDFADVNRDGHDDFFVLDMLARDHRERMNQMGDRKPPNYQPGQIDNRPQYLMNTLFLNRGDGTYAEISAYAGVAMADWAWTPVFLDVDLDGWEDLLITNGHERNARDLDGIDKMRQLRATQKLSKQELLQARKVFPKFATANLAFRNRRDLTFEEAGHEWGFDAVGVSHGMALADLDNDGDLDVVINNLNGPALLYRNESVAPRIEVRLRGQPPNTRGIGAKVKVTGGPVAQSQEMISGGRYLSSDDSVRTFAAGSLTNLLEIAVSWRSGARSRITGARANRIYEVEEPAAGSGESTEDNGHRAEGNGIASKEERQTFNVQRQTMGVPMFQDVSGLLNHRHQDEAFNDFEIEPLLPRHLSNLGPGVLFCDVDGDGWDDVVVGSGKGGSLAAFRNRGDGTFERWGGRAAEIATRDQTTILSWRQGSGEPGVLIGNSNYEDGLAAGACVREVNLSSGASAEKIAGQPWAAGALAMADMDGDGELDLFVGGRCIPGKYPESTPSLLFRKHGGKFEVDIENSKALAPAGMVSGAAFIDINGDGWPDLVLACDWGPVRVFQNEKGHFFEKTQQLGLSGYVGWWNGVASGDFDGDGRLDFIVTNWGRNFLEKAFSRGPLGIYFGDFDNDGIEDVLETYEDERGRIVPLRELDLLARWLPFLKERFGTHRQFGEAAIDELLSGKMNNVRALKASWFDSTVFMNRGTRFEAIPLPSEAQFAPAFGACAGDFDGDGQQDLFLSQNFFGTRPEAPRLDAGRGLLLRGDGTGHFLAVPGQTSGIVMCGEQRGCAAGDFDRDGRLDLVVAQNGAETKLYRNLSGKPGLRVRLAGPAGNPRAIGAALRLESGERKGPVTEIEAGSGYWSQESQTKILTGSSGTEVWVRWPGGKETRSRVPAGAVEIEVGVSGEVRRVR